MKIVKEHMGLPTDTSAFRDMEAFLSGLKLPLEDAVTVSEEEHRKLSKSFSNPLLKMSPVTYY